MSIRVQFRDQGPNWAHDLFEDTDYSGAKASFRTAALHWQEVVMILENEHDLPDVVVLHAFQGKSPTEIAQELVSVQPMSDEAFRAIQNLTNPLHLK